MIWVVTTAVLFQLRAQSKWRPSDESDTSWLLAGITRGNGCVLLCNIIYSQHVSQGDAQAQHFGYVTTGYDVLVGYKGTVEWRLYVTVEALKDWLPPLMLKL